MLSYRHEYHAGNHADVLKHAVLTLVVGALQKKPAPLRIFDAHAGSGRYDLRSREARLHAEHESGIARVLAAPSPPVLLAAYLAAVRQVNPGALREYPGSPGIAQSLLRASDHLVLMELHPRALPALRRAIGRDQRAHIHARDCFEGLPALLPPPERRGLALIDPSYEVKDEYTRVAELLATCHARWPGGVYLIWYPLIRHREAERFPARMARSGVRNILQMTLEVEEPAYDGLRGSGLLVVNPPFGLHEQCAQLLPWLHTTLAEGRRGGWHLNWLVPE